MIAGRAIQRPLAAVFLLVGCDPAVPQGVFQCSDDSQCPSSWVCEARAPDPEARCFQRGSAVVVGMDAGGTPRFSGPGQIFVPDAASGYACGGWKRVQATDAIPANAKAYGIEHSDKGSRPEYVCRFDTMVEGKPLVVQGRAVFGTVGCLAALPAGEQVPARASASSSFELLTDTEVCGRMVTYYEEVRLLPTGTDAQGKPTFSCRGIVRSQNDLPDKSQYLGRFLPETKQCAFHYYGNVRAAPSLTNLALEESFEVLAGPS